jgi:uncharacterized lipoprotein YajG
VREAWAQYFLTFGCGWVIYISMKAKISSLLLGIALLAGCATTDKTEADREQRPPTDPGRVTLLFSRPTKSYVELGTVSTLKVQPNRGQTWQQVLRRQGAARGADAVMVDMGAPNNINTPMINGTAIRYAP